jgi:hypothetical protein
VCGSDRLLLRDGALQSIVLEMVGDVGDTAAHDLYQLGKHGLRFQTRPLREACRRALARPEVVAPVATAATIDAFTIDPPGCKDFDDAFSVAEHADGSFLVGVHIANVAGFMGAAGLYGLLEAAQSVYMPSSTYNMLPGTLSTSRLSLAAGSTRDVVSITFCVEASGRVSVRPAELRTCRITDNFVYGSREMTTDSRYSVFSRATRIAAKNAKNNNNNAVDIGDSHDEVAWWMVRYNGAIGDVLSREKVGIHRTCSLAGDGPASRLQRLGLVELSSWEGRYERWHSGVEHCALGLKAYAQASSPLRRMSDLVNQCLVLGLLGVVHPGSEALWSRWSSVDGVSTLNAQTKSAKKAERAARLLSELSTAAVDVVGLESVCVSCGPDRNPAMMRSEFYVTKLRACVYASRSEPCVPGVEYTLVLHSKPCGINVLHGFAIDVG